MPLALSCLAVTLSLTPSAPIRALTPQGQWVEPLAATADSRGTVFLFILADCPIARRYMPEIRRIAETCRESKVVFHLVHADATLSQAEARRHVEEYGLAGISVLVDREKALIRRSGVKTVPEAALLDPSGRMVYRGRIDDRFPSVGVQRSAPRRQDLRIALNEFLAGKPVTLPRTTAVGCHIP